MPRSNFRPAEVAFLRSRIPEWIRTKSLPATKSNANSLLAERRVLIRSIAEELLLKFPDRDPSVSDPTAVTYTQEDLERLPERLRQWYRNNTRSPVDPENRLKPKQRGRTHARNIAAQRFSQEIKEIARELRSADKDLQPLTAYNHATTQFITELQQEDPEAYEKLFHDAKEMRGHAAMNYADLSPEVVSSLLEKFPARLLSELEQYGNELPVHIWCICAFARPPEQRLELYTVCTPSIDGISGSVFDSLSRKEFLAWIQKNLGASASLQVETATPMVYPAIHRSSRPHLPVAEIRTLSSHRLRSWLRTYFNYHFRWQGGQSAAPWKLLAADALNDNIPKECFPEGIDRLRLPNDMLSDELQTWYQWLINGQQGRLNDSQLFRFAKVSTGRNKVVIDYPNPITSRPQNCNLVWSAEEKLYALKVQNLLDESQVKPSWKQLPLARTELVYNPFSDKIRNAMRFGCLDIYQTESLTKLVFRLEKYGPVHTRDSACTEPLINYISPEMTEEYLLRTFLGKTPLKSAALAEDDPNHADYALPTFIYWAKSTQRFRHTQSQTWRGGPFGVRWIVALYLHFAASFSVYELQPRNLPTDCLEAFDNCHFSRLKDALVNFGGWLIESLKESISILKETFAERATCWGEAIVASHLAEPNESIGNTSATTDTHGVPRSRSILKDCYERLKIANPDVTMGQDDELSYRLRRHVSKQAEVTFAIDELELSDHDSTSPDSIEKLSDDSNNDSSSDTNEEGSKAETDIEFGISKSRINDPASFTRFDASDKEPLEPRVSEENKHSPIYSTDDPPDQFLREPSWASDNNAEDTNDEDAELPSRVLDRMSPQKLPRPRRPGKRGGMTMEVVINTPRSRANLQQSKREVHESHKGSSAGGSESSSEESPRRSGTAQLRPRRSFGRNERAEEAIKMAQKGRYKRD
ncbi:glycoside hydrolase 15-related protein [Rhizoctonia solani AG-1 IB]|uniref:Glycoside hydrolase 15-related protein n=1 Tax=Thanatephorus cucumeris (strain AG1-IB / isolate 7/3/14) TaxID=1108050 RepID=A0A0B7FB20_THACB|nr:glycoside hydrolase 15-related protein [Rhizoctonia solani AG-1 IB]